MGDLHKVLQKARAVQMRNMSTAQAEQAGRADATQQTATGGGNGLFLTQSPTPQPSENTQPDPRTMISRLPQSSQAPTGRVADDEDQTKKSIERPAKRQRASDQANAAGPKPGHATVEPGHAAPSAQERADTNRSGANGNRVTQATPAVDAVIDFTNDRDNDNDNEDEGNGEDEEITMTTHLPKTNIEVKDAMLFKEVRKRGLRIFEYHSRLCENLSDDKGKIMQTRLSGHVRGLLKAGSLQELMKVYESTGCKALKDAHTMISRHLDMYEDFYEGCPNIAIDKFFKEKVVDYQDTWVSKMQEHRLWWDHLIHDLKQLPKTVLNRK